MSTIRRQISIANTPRAVWNALTTSEGLASWLGTQARIDPREGGRVVVTLRGSDPPAEEVGMLHVFKPTARMEINWDKASRGPWKGTVTQFQVARDGKETVLNVQHLGSAFEDEAMRATADGIWKHALLALREGLEGA